MNKTDWNAVRVQFPVCSRITYLNSAGGAPMCAEASKEGKKYFDEMLLHGDACWDEWLARTDEVRHKLAAYIGASPEEVAFMPNTSMAMGIIAQLLNNSGGLLTMEDEFPSSTVPWIQLGYQVSFVLPEQGEYPVRNIKNALRPEHKILVISYVQYKTGYRQKLREIGKFCRSNNLLLVVNATQGMGVFPLDVSANEIDFLVFSGLKWACAGYGAAGLYISRRHLTALKMPIAGWRSVMSPENMNNKRFVVKTEASVLEAGSPSFPAVFALGGALDLFNRIGPVNCTNRVLYLSRYLEDQLRTNGFPVMYSFEEGNRSGIIMLRTDNAKEIVVELARKNIMVSARGEGLRISVNIFNNESDVSTLLKNLLALKSLF